MRHIVRPISYAGTVATGNHSIQVTTSSYPDASVNPFERLAFRGHGAGTASNPYQIASPDQLDAVRDHMESGTFFKLTAHLNLSSYLNWEPIGSERAPFNGEFDGNGYTITHLNIHRSTNDLGLFGGVGREGKLTNVKLEQVNVSGSSINTGGLVGYNLGTISHSSVSGTVSGFYYAGGLVGYNQGAISNSCENGTVGGYYMVGGLVGYPASGSLSNSYATGDVSGTHYVGGLVGYTTNTAISNSYATGKVSGIDHVGGLVGASYEFISSSNYYDSTTTHQSDRGKGIPKSAAEMKAQATFTAWSFNTNWYMLAGQYPQLWAHKAMMPGKVGGTIKLLDVSSGMAYSVDGVTYIPVPDSGVDDLPVNAGDCLSIRVIANPSNIKTWTVGLSDIRPAAKPTTVALTHGTVKGTMKLTGLRAGMEYQFNDSSYIAVAGTIVDNIAAEAGDPISVRIAETDRQPASEAIRISLDLRGQVAGGRSERDHGTRKLQRRMTFLARVNMFW